MLRIAIVDDDRESAVVLQSAVARFCKGQGLPWETRCLADGLALVDGYEPCYDLIFLDIDMPGLNGIDAARAIRRTDRETDIIFVTNLAQYAIRGYEVEAVDFLVKPVEYPSFEMAFRKFLRQYQRREGERAALPLKEGLRILSFRDILYVEIMGHYLTYHTRDGDFTVKGTLSDAETALKNGPFFKCNRCYIVNVHSITLVDRDSIRIGDIRVEVSRSKRKEMMQAVLLSVGGSI